MLYYAIIKKGVQTLRTGQSILLRILGFIMSIMLVQQLMGYGGQSTPLTFNNLLLLLSECPKLSEWPGFKALMSTFSYLANNGSDVLFIGPLLSVIGKTGLTLFKPFEWIINGLHACFTLFYWIIASLFPDLFFLLH